MSSHRHPFRKAFLSILASRVPALASAQGPAQESEPPLWLRTLRDYPALTDQFRHLKRHLNALKARDGLKIFALAAPHRHAGVSTLVCNLGLILSRDFLDQRILLVDACQHRPSLHSAFGVQRRPGLLDYLLHSQDLPQVCQTTFRPNLDLAASGETSPEVASPYDLKRFRDFLEEARRHYDFVLLDCPPAFESSDAQVISGKVDGVVIIAEANRLRYEVLLAFLQEMGSQAKLVGCVFNKRQYVIPNFLYRYV